jgi:hypothetical protein
MRRARALPPPSAAGDRLVDEDWANVETDDIFEEGLHAWAANLTVPMMMISMLAALALFVVTVVQGRSALASETSSGAVSVGTGRRPST